jgi:MoaA/NifB/PqqE/SkfB family radical SAM enzyme
MRETPVITPNDKPCPRINLKRYAVIPVWYGCNSSCTICMLSRIKGKLGTVDFGHFRKLITALIKDGRYDNLILSGAEITTFDQIEQYVRYAGSYQYFRKIQIQTNGRRLADKEYLGKLVDAGVNEFFVSVHGQEEVHDAITRTPGSYAATMKGIGNLAEFPVNVITNTVLTTFNYHRIVSLLGELCSAPVSEMHLWNFFPMDKSDRSDLVVSMSDLVALFTGIISAIGPSGKPLVLKGFPECLSPGAPCFIDSDFPLNLIQDDFWLEFTKNGFGTCIYKESCCAKECWGLSSAYIEKYGDERALLSPITGNEMASVSGGHL